MRRSEESSPSYRNDGLFLGAATLVFVFLALRSSGWPALVWAVLAVGFAAGVVADSTLDTPRRGAAPASPVGHRHRRAA